MKNKIKVSVVMPVYNSDKYLNQAIISVLEQSFDNFEFIIINDGSTDSSQRIVKEFITFDKRIFLINQKNLGYSIALNRGFRTCTGDYIARMDADDICHPDRFLHQVRFLNHYKNIDLVGGAIKIINAEGNVYDKKSFPSSRKMLSLMIDDETPLAHPTVMFRKQVIEKIGFYRQNFEPAEDYDLWLRCYDSNFQISNLKRVVMHYRVHSDSVSRKRKAQQLTKTLIAKKLSLMRRENIKDFVNNNTIVNKELFKKLPKKFYPTKMEIIWIGIKDINDYSLEGLKSLTVKVNKINSLNQNDQRIKIIIFLRIMKVCFNNRNPILSLKLLCALLTKHSFVLFKTIILRYI